jgi:hypothetical protein
MPSRCDLIHRSLTKGVSGPWRDFSRKSEVRKPALWGREAGTDRVFLFDSLRGGLADPRLRATFSPAHPLARRDVPLARARAFLLFFFQSRMERMRGED